jgi:hypothetical protein
MKGTQVLDALQIKGLEKLPDLAKLDKARQLPTEDKAQRDLFLFDGPPLPPDPIPIVIPPRLTPEQLEAKKRAEEAARAAAILQGEKDAEMARRPNGLRYLGFIESPSAGIIGGFLKGEIPEQHKPGAIVGKGWKLVTLTDRKAEFQNLKFAELKFSLEAKDGTGAPAAAAVSNEF